MYKKRLSEHFFNFTVVSSIFRAKQGDIKMVFRGLIRADVRCEVFQLRRNTDMSMRTIGEACGISWSSVGRILRRGIRRNFSDRKKPPKTKCSTATSPGSKHKETA